MKYVKGYKYRKNGFTYLVLERIGDVAIVSQDGKWFEVFEVVKTKDREINGNKIMASEAVPSTEKWGINAFTVPTYEDAISKVIYITAAIERRNKQKV